MKPISIAEIPDVHELTNARELELDRRLDAYRKHPGVGSAWPEVRTRILNRSSTRK